MSEMAAQHLAQVASCLPYLLSDDSDVNPQDVSRLLRSLQVRREGGAGKRRGEGKGEREGKEGGERRGEERR